MRYKYLDGPVSEYHSDDQSVVIDEILGVLLFNIFPSLFAKNIRGLGMQKRLQFRCRFPSPASSSLTASATARASASSERVVRSVTMHTFRILFIIVSSVPTGKSSSMSA